MKPLIICVRKILSKPKIFAPTKIRINSDFDKSKALATLRAYDDDGPPPILRLQPQSQKLFEIRKNELFLTGNLTKNFKELAFIQALDSENSSMIDEVEILITGKFRKIDRQLFFQIQHE